MHGVHGVGGSNPPVPTSILKIWIFMSITVKQVSLRAALMCVLAALFYCYEYYLRVAPAVMRPELMQSFNLSDAGLGALVAYYYHAYVPLQLPVGIMMDKWGAKKVLVAACFICALGTLVFAGTTELALAKFGRFLIGFGSAFAYVGVLKIADSWLPNKYFAIVAGVATTLGMAGAMSGEIIMSKLVLVCGWRNTLYYASFGGLIFTLVLAIFLKNRPENEQPYKAPTVAKNDVGILEVLKKIILRKSVWVNGAIGCLAFLPLTIFAEMWAVTFLQESGMDRHSASIGSSIVFLGFGCGGPLWGTISDFLMRRRLPLFIGSLLSAFFTFWIVLFPSNNIALMYCLLFLSGFFAGAQVIVFAVANDITEKENLATTVAFTNMIIMLGGTFMQPLVGVILDRLSDYTLIDNQIVHSFSDFKKALIILPLGLVLSAVLSLVLKESHKSRMQNN
jgi:MFS family permease